MASSPTASHHSECGWLKNRFSLDMRLFYHTRSEVMPPCDSKLTPRGDAPVAIGIRPRSLVIGFEAIRFRITNDIPPMLFSAINA